MTQTIKNILKSGIREALKNEDTETIVEAIVEIDWTECLTDQVTVGHIDLTASQIETAAKEMKTEASKKAKDLKAAEKAAMAEYKKAMRIARRATLA